MSQRCIRVHRPVVALAAGALLALAALAPAARAAPAQVAYALSGTNLLAFDPATPATVQTTAITGVNAGETVVGIDVRPQNGMLYALGVDGAGNTATLYAVGRTTGFAGVVSPAPSQIAFTTDGSTPVDLPDPATVGYGFDVNPAADRVRVVAGSLNFRVNPNTGLPVDGDNTGLTSGTVTGTNPDGPTNGATTTVDATAYTNNRPNNGGVTTLYTLDAATNSLYIQSNPNAGTQTLGQPVTLGGSPLDFTAVTGFDIDPAVNAPASNAAVSAGVGYAALNVGGTTGLYAIDLVNGAATLVGNIANGTAAVQGLALQRDFDDAGYPVVGLNGVGDTILRFASATPGTVTSQAINLAAVAAGEVLAALALRPQTGQYVALGVNAAANTATLYLLDPQTGAPTAIGTPGQIAWAQLDGTTPVDLPDPATAAWGMDLNPTVDRVRIVTSTGLNARINPTTGGAVDGEPGSPGTNPDGPINGLGVAGLSATSYTNAFTQPLTGGVTTQVTLDAATDALYIQTPPNAGTQTQPRPLSANGAPVDAGTLAGLDIPGDVAVTTSGTPAPGEGIAALTVAGTTAIYRVRLANGSLVSLGAVGAGVTPLRSIAVGDAQRDRPVGTRSPATLAFGERDIDDGPGSTLTSTVTNPGSTTVALTAITAGGADPGEFELLTGAATDCAAGTVLETSQTCEVRGRFDPSSIGAKAASITVSSNAPDIAIALSGTGIDPVVAPPPPPPVAPPPPPPPPPPPVAPGEPTVTQSWLARLVGKRLNTSLVLACPPSHAGPCTGSVVVTRRSIRPGNDAITRVGFATFSVAPGAKQTLRVTPTLAVRRLLRRTAPLPLVVTVLADGAQGPARRHRFTAVNERGQG